MKFEIHLKYIYKYTFLISKIDSFMKAYLSFEY